VEDGLFRWLPIAFTFEIQNGNISLQECEGKAIHVKKKYLPLHTEVQAIE
jgi:hypothetical protein